MSSNRSGLQSGLAGSGEEGNELSTIQRQGALTREKSGGQSNEGRDLRKDNQVASSTPQIDEQKHEELTKKFNKRASIIDRIKDVFARIAHFFDEGLKYWLDSNTVVDPI